MTRLPTPYPQRPVPSVSASWPCPCREFACHSRPRAVRGASSPAVCNTSSRSVSSAKPSRVVDVVAWRLYPCFRSPWSWCGTWAVMTCGPVAESRCSQGAFFADPLSAERPSQPYHRRVSLSAKQVEPALGRGPSSLPRPRPTRGPGSAGPIPSRSDRRRPSAYRRSAPPTFRSSSPPPPSNSLTTCGGRTYADRCSRSISSSRDPDSSQAWVEEEVSSGPSEDSPRHASPRPGSARPTRPRSRPAVSPGSARSSGSPSRSENALS